MNKRIREKKRKKDMKDWGCDLCGIPMKVDKDYEPNVCCSGYLCGCDGLPLNRVFCHSCYHKVYK